MLIEAFNHLWQQLKDQEFLQVVEVLEKRRAVWTDRDWREVGTMGTAYLCLRDYDAAAECFLLEQPTVN
jgi:hypothetical protein